MAGDTVIWTTVLSTISLFISIMVAIFFMGIRWAKVGAKVDIIDRRLESIEKLFRLQLKDDGHDRSPKDYV